MSDRLFLNDTEVDLNPGTVIALTFQINDVSSLSDRQANYTNQFKIPRTQRNRAVIEQADIPTRVTTYPYRKLRAKVYKEGIEVISNGYAIIESIGADIAVTVYGGTIDFFKLLDGKSLRDLQLSNWNHLWNINYANGSANNSAGYVYGIIDNSDETLAIDPTSDSVNIERTAPCFYIHTLVEQIITEAGYTPAGDVLNDPFYRKAVMQLGSDGLVAGGLILRAKPTQAISAHTYTPAGPLVLPLAFDDDNSGNAITQQGNFDALGIYNNTTGELTFSADANVPSEFTMRWGFTFNAYQRGGSDINVEVAVQKNGVDIYTRMLLQNWPQGSTYTGSGTVDLPAGTYSSGDVVKAVIRTRWPDPGLLRNDLLVSTDSIVEANVLGSTPLTLNSPVNISRNLPDWSQIDFLKAVGQAFGFIWEPDQVTRSLYTGSMAEIVRNLMYANDWSDKLHNVEDANGVHTVDMKFQIGNYAQVNVFQYSNDEGVPVNLGTGYAVIDDQTLEDKAEAITLPWSASDKILTFQYQEYVTKVVMWEVDGTQRAVTPRLLWLERDNNPTNTYRWADGGGNTAVMNTVNRLWFQKIGAMQNLGFDDSLLRDYYNVYARIFNRALMITAQFKLNAVDIQNLDHFVPVYIRQFGNYFYINKVINYVGSDKLTKVELVKIGEAIGSTLVTVYPEVILNGSFNEGISDDGNFGMKHWTTPYREWNNSSPTTQLQNGCYYDYMNGSQIPLSQAFPVPLDNGGVYELKFTINEFTAGAFDCNIKNLSNGVEFQVAQGTVSGIPSGVEYVTQFTVNGTDWASIEFVPTAVFDGGIYGVSLRRVA